MLHGIRRNYISGFLFSVRQPESSTVDTQLIFFHLMVSSPDDCRLNQLFHQGLHNAVSNSTIPTLGVSWNSF